MLGCRSRTLLSATAWDDTDDLILSTPMCLGLLPEVGRFFLMPPLETRILTTMTPSFALYPMALALSSRQGRSTLSMAGSFLSSTALFLMSPDFSWKIFCQVWETCLYKR